MDMFSALAEPTRRSIIEMLAGEGQLSVSDIAARFDVSAPAISQHLKILREADLVWVEKRAQQRIYRLNPDAMREFEQWGPENAGALGRALRCVGSGVGSGESRRQPQTQMMPAVSWRIEMSKTILIAEPGKQEVTATRLFDAPRELVFKAYSEPGSHPAVAGAARPHHGPRWRLTSVLGARGAMSTATPRGTNTVSTASIIR